MPMLPSHWVKIYPFGSLEIPRVDMCRRILDRLSGSATLNASL